jgi:outer membrane protein OmpA-like peptidoglycan-associated protein
MSRDRERPAWTPTSRPMKSSDPEHPEREALAEEARPLEGSTREAMESRFGEDFSSVRIHAGPQAAESARRAGARAYASGEDVVFGAGRLAPETAAGAGLLEHELGHVVEHRRGAPPGIYRAPEEGPELQSDPVGASTRFAPELRLDPKLGSLSLGLATLDGFDFNDATLKPDHGPKLADVVDKLFMLMQKLPGGRITVTGHTDLVGGEDVNLRVGLNRAEVVREALVKAGVPDASIHAASEGRQRPAVQTRQREPRNRRVEVRFEGTLLVSGLGLPGYLQPPTLQPPSGQPGGGVLTPPVPPTPAPSPFGPAALPPTAPPQPAPPTPKGIEGPPRAGTAGDVAKAIAAIPEVKRLIDAAKAGTLDELKKLPTGEKVLLGTVTVSIAGGAIAGLSTDPAARAAALDAVDGVEIPVPGVPWLKVKPVTKGGAAGGVIQVDVLQIVRELK